MGKRMGPMSRGVGPMSKKIVCARLSPWTALLQYTLQCLSPQWRPCPQLPEVQACTSCGGCFALLPSRLTGKPSWEDNMGKYQGKTS